ncbi:NAD(P)H-dependent oxidoreductase [Methanobacterium aggregans]|uniref:NAD(P)H-dependent oxidoreductase n=1 Tax=Methanobacterium aggregans TaxID=1615586 RepID=UPI001AEAD749|nr:NAD(P)H-dependent oxidoreductase [Methanobacterium aggregans]MBP2045363.1 NAD(P)H dehydrogenase (quinone) [Methanobacterium aggregans]
MNVFIVFAHPEPTSLNGTIKDIAVKILKNNGHEVKISDLYGINFKAVLDQEDFASRKNPESFNPMIEQVNAVANGTLPQDIQDEVEKLKWADILILQFPVWWSSMPAILKGWIDRVFLPGVVHNMGEGKVYNEGLLNGKKAMLSFTTGSPQELYSSEGPHGDLNEAFRSITHTIFEFAGLEVMPSFGLYGAAMRSEEDVKMELEKFKQVLNSI